MTNDSIASLNDLTKKWKQHSISQKFDLRAKLIDACAKHEGWEESAIAIVDEAIMPIIHQHNVEWNTHHKATKVTDQSTKTSWTCPDCCVNPCRCEIVSKVAKQPDNNYGNFASALNSSSIGDAASANRDDNPGTPSTHQPIDCRMET